MDPPCLFMLNDEARLPFEAQMFFKRIHGLRPLLFGQLLALPRVHVCVVEIIFTARSLGVRLHVAERVRHISWAKPSKLHDAHPVIVFGIEQVTAEETAVLPTSSLDDHASNPIVARTRFHRVLARP